MTDPSSGINPRIVIMFSLYVLGMPLVLFFVAGDWSWSMGWFFYLFHIFFSLGSRFLVWRRNPSLLAERAQSAAHEDTPGYDRWLAPFVGLLGPLLSYVLIGFDHRFGWTPMLNYSIAWACMALTVFMYAFASWALVANAYFSGVMRVQDDRGHKVISGGPYAIVRHPGYAGALGAYFTTPLALSSLWGLTMSITLAAALVVRTALEDRTLHAELEGYPAYAQKVRWRLIPGVW